jgi:hypothetical protein
MSPDSRSHIKESFSHLWFLVRVGIGFVIHVALIVCAVGFTEHAVELSYLVKDHHMNQNFTAVMTGTSAFTAAMAGVYWVKARFIQLFLPECLDEATKKLQQ